MTIIRYETSLEEMKAILKQPKPSVFLAGPTVRGNQPHLTSWRFAAIEEFQKQGFDGTLVVPEFTSKTQSDKGVLWIPEWEHNGLKRCTVIMFWIPRTRELIGLTTNQELGYWMARDRDKIVYGRPDDAYRIRYQDIMWEIDAKDRCISINNIKSIRNTLEDTVQSACILADYIQQIQIDSNWNVSQ